MVYRSFREKLRQKLEESGGLSLAANNRLNSNQDALILAGDGSHVLNSGGHRRRSSTSSNTSSPAVPGRTRGRTQGRSSGKRRRLNEEDEEDDENDEDDDDEGDEGIGGNGVGGRRGGGNHMGDMDDMDLMMEMDHDDEMRSSSTSGSSRRRQDSSQNSRNEDSIRQSQSRHARHQSQRYREYKEEEEQRLSYRHHQGGGYSEGTHYNNSYPPTASPASSSSNANDSVVKRRRKTGLSIAVPTSSTSSNSQEEGRVVESGGHLTGGLNSLSGLASFPTTASMMNSPSFGSFMPLSSSFSESNFPNFLGEDGEEDDDMVGEFEREEKPGNANLDNEQQETSSSRYETRRRTGHDKRSKYGENYSHGMGSGGGSHSSPSNHNNNSSNSALNSKSTRFQQKNNASNNIPSTSGSQERPATKKKPFLDASELGLGNSIDGGPLSTANFESLFSKPLGSFTHDSLRFDFDGNSSTSGGMLTSSGIGGSNVTTLASSGNLGFNLNLGGNSPFPYAWGPSSLGTLGTLGTGGGEGTFSFESLKPAGSTTTENLQTGAINNTSNSNSTVSTSSSASPTTSQVPSNGILLSNSNNVTSTMSPGSESYGLHGKKLLKVKMEASSSSPPRNV